jgi:hypothetical protein
MPTPDPISEGELKATLGSIMNEVLQTDLDATTKRIVVEALKHMYPWLEVHRRRRLFN